MFRNYVVRVSEKSIIFAILRGGTWYSNSFLSFCQLVTNETSIYSEDNLEYIDVSQKTMLSISRHELDYQVSSGASLGGLICYIHAE